MAPLRLAALWVAALSWNCSLALHVAATVGFLVTPPSEWKVWTTWWLAITLFIGVVVTRVTLPARRNLNCIPRWDAVSIFGASVLVWSWPLIFGPGFPAYGHVPGATGVATGPPGDRHLSKHGERTRTLTEAEYQLAWQWSNIQITGLSVGAAGTFLAGVLYFRQMQRMSNDGPPDSAANSGAT